MSVYESQEGGIPALPEINLPVIDRLSAHPADGPWIAAERALPFWQTFVEFSAHTGDCLVCAHGLDSDGPLCDEGDALQYAAQWDMDAQRQASYLN